MGWADMAILELQQGNTVQVTPRGHSMTGKVNHGDRVTLEPVDPAWLDVGDIVLVRVHGTVYLHLVKARNGGRFLIGNNRGGTNGWVGHNCIFGRATCVESPTSRSSKKRRAGEGDEGEEVMLGADRKALDRRRPGRP